MMFRNLFYIGLFWFLFGCKDNSQKIKTETFQIDGDTITTKSTESANSLDANYQLADLTPELTKQISDQLKKAEVLIIKYYGELPPTKYDAKILDEVFERWQQNKDKTKEKPEYIIEAMGAALGQNIANELGCEWKILTDQYGSDLTVIHKKYKVNGFPFSSVEKAYTEKRVGSFQDIKLTIKKNILDAEKGGEIEVRK